MGVLTEAVQRRGRQPHPRGAGRVRGPVAPAGRRGLEERRLRRRGRAGRGRSAAAATSQVTADEGVRGDTTVESLAKLRPAFSKDGTITAGSASQISDGACAVVVMSKAKAEELGLDVAGRDRRPRPGGRPRLDPAAAAGQRDRARPCEKEGIAAADLDLVEINEAFAAVGIASTRELGLAEDKVNVNGGAIALGHPIGMSGARIVLHLALELKRRGGGIGAAALCGGGGQGDALIVRVPCRARGRELTATSSALDVADARRRGPARATPARSRG